MKCPGIGGVNGFAQPLWGGIVNKARGAVTHGTGAAAGVATDTGSEYFTKMVPAFIMAHILYGADIRVAIHLGWFGDGLCRQLIMDYRVSVSADGAVILKIPGSFQSFFEALSADEKVLGALPDHERFSATQFGQHLASANHSLAGDTDDVQLFSLDLLFQDLKNNVARVAALGHYSHSVPSSRKIGREIVAAKRVPVELVHLFNLVD